MRILLAEDERELREALSAILRHSGYSVDAHKGKISIDPPDGNTFMVKIIL